MKISRNAPKMLITGVSGLLGSNLAHAFSPVYRVVGLYNTHAVNIFGAATRPCDITDEQAVRELICEEAPEVVIHCASLTSIDQCETDPQHAHRVNVLGTRHLCRAMEGSDAKMVYISSDSVYEGTRGGYREDDPVNPQNVYGKTKLQGENEVGVLVGGLIFRTNIFGMNVLEKRSIGEWFLEELEAGREIFGFSDAVFSTIYSFELARILDICLQQRLSGLYNCAARDFCSKYEFGKKVGAAFSLTADRIRPISIDQSKLRAKRGKNLSMSVEKLAQALKYRLPSIDQSVEAFYRDRKCGRHKRIGEITTKKNDLPRFLQYGRQWIGQDDIDAVAEVLRSDRLTQGPTIADFETSLARLSTADFAVAVNSGTSALHIACRAAEVGPGDEVITSPITFVASANCAVYCGAKPVFADIDPATFNMSAEDLGQKLSARTKAVIPVHFAGQSCDMEAIHGVVRSAESRFGRKIYIIEDASHAIGSMYHGRPVGCCEYSDLATTSFHPVKHITTGEGGAVFTNDVHLLKRMIRLRSHGITSTPEDLVNREFAFSNGDESSDTMLPWYYEQQDLGYNYRITDIQCALGISQLSKLDIFRRRRRRIVDFYNAAFTQRPVLKTPLEQVLGSTNFHLYVLLIQFSRIGRTRAAFMRELFDRGIQTQVHYIPVHTQPFFQEQFGTRWGDCPNAEAYYAQCLSIPLFPEMTTDDAQRVVREIVQLIGERT